MGTRTLRSRILTSSTMPWTIPVGIAAVVVAAAVAVPVVADTDAELPERSAGDLLVDLAESRGVPMSGTIVHSADVGIPDLPDVSDGTSSPLALLSGATSARLWYSDETTYRIALHGDLAETDLIRDGNELWYWNSEQNVVMHHTVDSDESSASRFGEHPMSMLSTDAMAQLALDLVEPSTRIEVDGTATVAGRDAYELVAVPRDERSLVGSVRVAVDAEHGVPLRVRVYAADGGDPAVEIGYTSVSFGEPDRSALEFTPPPDATVEEDFDLGTWLSEQHERTDESLAGLAEDLDVELVGEGWTSVLVVSGLSVADLTAQLEGMLDDSEQFGDLSALAEGFVSEMEPMRGPYGTGLGLESRLLSVLWLDDGRLLVGAVSMDVLEETAT